MAEIRDFGPRKTIFILAIVAGCFAVLWPKIFYPMLIGSVNTHHSLPVSSTCCDVIFQSDVTAVDIMQEMCQNILRHHQVDPKVREALKKSKLTPYSANLCRQEVLARCGLDLSSFLAEEKSLGKTYKQVLEEIRSFNGSFCLKVNFGIPLSQLGTPHLIRYHILMPHNTLKQERQTPLHAGSLHPALRERGRAIPSSHIVPRVDRSADPIVPKMRPPLGGAGHVVPAPKGSGTMGIVMPLYTLGIVLFFLYTIVKVLKKNSDSEIMSEYPGAAAEREFRQMVFNPEVLATAMTGGTMHHHRESSPTTFEPMPTMDELNEQAAGEIEIDHLRRRLVETEAAMERIVVQMGNISRSVGHNTSSQPDFKGNVGCEELENIEQSPTIKVMGMEMTASCEGGQKCSRPTTPVIPSIHSHPEPEVTIPTSIYLEGALPPQCELLVTESETQTQQTDEDVEAPIVLSGKMTLSLISLDQIATESSQDNDTITKTNEKLLNFYNNEPAMLENNDDDYYNNKNINAKNHGEKEENEDEEDEESESEVEEDEEIENEDEDDDIEDEEKSESEDEQDDEDENSENHEKQNDRLISINKNHNYDIDEYDITNNYEQKILEIKNVDQKEESDGEVYDDDDDNEDETDNDDYDSEEGEEYVSPQIHKGKTFVDEDEDDEEQETEEEIE